MDKKIAILLMVHNINSQLDQFINSFNPNLFDIYIHVDKKVKNINELKKFSNVKLLDTRIDITWSHISQVEVQMLLLHEAYKKEQYSHYVLISGQDLPIKNTDFIYKFYLDNNDYSFINIMDEAEVNKEFIYRNSVKYPKWMLKRNVFIRIIKKIYTKTGIILGKVPKDKHYFGSSWMSLNEDFVKYFVTNVSIDDVLNTYKYALCPDESVIHTIFMNSPYKGKRKEYLTLVAWEKNNASPKTFKTEDYNFIIYNNYMYARKFDYKVDQIIIDKILKHIRGENKQ